MVIFHSYVKLPEGTKNGGFNIKKKNENYEFVRLDHHPNYWGK